MRLQLKSVVCNAAAAAAAALAWFRLELGLTGCALTKLKKNASFILAPKAQTKAQKQGRPQKGGVLKDDQLAAAVILCFALFEICHPQIHAQTHAPSRASQVTRRGLFPFFSLK